MKFVINNKIIAGSEEIPAAKYIMHFISQNYMFAKQSNTEKLLFFVCWIMIIIISDAGENI